MPIPKWVTNWFVRHIYTFQLVLNASTGSRPRPLWFCRELPNFVGMRNIRRVSHKFYEGEEEGDYVGFGFHNLLFEASA